MPQPLSVAVRKMAPIRGHTLVGLKQDVTVRVYAGGGICLEIDGSTFAVESRAEALQLLEEYLRRAQERADGVAVVTGL